MIKTEIYGVREDGVKLLRTFSDKGLSLKKKGTDEIYSEAIDVESASYIYEETSEIIPEENNEKDN